MGCLNYSNRFDHWFGNIHLSGPCNRRCYFCIGQHMMALDGENNLDSWPLDGLSEFVKECRHRGIFEINLTGTNTDPLLYQHTENLREFLEKNIPGLVLGVRTNGAANLQRLMFYDKASVTICSADSKINKLIMGGVASDLLRLTRYIPSNEIKINTVLCPENYDQIIDVVDLAREYGIHKVNLREPYGQPYLGIPDPFRIMAPRGFIFTTTPWWELNGVKVYYWNVHYVHVQSVNLYATGRISVDYPITKGCCEDGIVQPQLEFTGGRIREQWVS